MIQEQKHLSNFSLKEALDYRNKLQYQIEQLQQQIFYWSGICDFLKDKEAVELAEKQAQEKK